MSDGVVHELPAPPDALNRGGREVLRAFVVEDELRVSIADAFDRPEVWGVLLVDIARQAAGMIARETGGSREQVLNLIGRAFDTEWESPVADPAAHH